MYIDFKMQYGIEKFGKNTISDIGSALKYFTES